MDRSIVYPGSIPLDTDLLATNRNVMIAMGALAQATLGLSPVIDGLTVSPTTPATLSVVCSPGSITQFSTVDQNAYGSLAADTADGLLKMGVNLSSTTIAFVAPTTSGQVISYLIEANFQESDASPVVLPYYNAANPTSPYLGPNNTGSAQSTQRIQRVQLQVKASPPATSGSQVTPSVDAGWSSVAVITVASGQTQITATSITQMATSPTLQFKLPSLRPGFSQLQSFTSSGGFTVPIGVTRARITVIGGGGSGGSHTNLPSGGGGGGATGIRILAGLAPGAVVAVTVGAAGGAPINGSGGNGGTSSFGAYVSATGGMGGGGGSSSTTTAGGSGGGSVGGDLNFAGSYGTDSVIPAARGGDGGGSGSARGATGYVQGLTAQGYGGGGGGGGASNTVGTGTGAPGGNGGPGLVIVEY